MIFQSNSGASFQVQELPERLQSRDGVIPYHYCYYTQYIIAHDRAGLSVILPSFKSSQITMGYTLSNGFG